MAPEIDGRLLINDGFAPAGTLVEVEITDAYADDLVGTSWTASPDERAERRPSPCRLSHPSASSRRVTRDLPRGVIATIGNYDGVHRGQRGVLDLVDARARETGLQAVVVTFDPHPLSVLHPEVEISLLTTQAQKEALLDEAGVDYVVVVRFTPELAKMPARTFVRDFLWGALEAREIYVGSRFAFGHRREGDLSLLRQMGESYGFAAFAVDEVTHLGEPISSTRIRSACSRATSRWRASCSAGPTRSPG